jgi:hypothetical protein
MTKAYGIRKSGLRKTKKQKNWEKEDWGIGKFFQSQPFFTDFDCPKAVGVFNLKEISQFPNLKIPLSLILF